MSEALDRQAAGKASALLGGMDAAKAAGLLVVGALLTLGLLRKSFGGVRVGLGD